MSQYIFVTLFPYINMSVLALCIISLLTKHFLKQGTTRSERYNKVARVFDTIRLIIGVICMFYFAYLIAMGVYFLLISF